jgi:acylphosphatase
MERTTSAQMTNNAKDRRSVRVVIEGRVQGVGFRYWAERVARELGLAGWVRNRRDGSVEALFAGPPDDVSEMLDRCREGPASAAVTSVRVVEGAGEAADGFEVLPTA